MATKAKPKKKGSGSSKGSGSRKKAAAPSQNWRVVRVVTGLIFAVLALYTFAVLLSYIFTWSKDASLVTNPQMLDASQGVKNIGGKLGFLWSNQLGNVTWVIRQKYDQHSGMANVLKQMQKSLKGDLRKLMAEIMTAWFVEN